MKKLFAIILSLGLIIAPMPVAHAQGGGGGYAKQILGMANGIIGSAILTKCKLGSTQLSVLAYMAGSLVFVAAEILGGKKKQKSVDQQSKDLDKTKDAMKEGGDYQMAAIDAQIADEESTLEFIQKRRKWMMATKAIYAAATALAVLEIWWALPTPAGINKPFAAACSGGTPTHKPITKTIIMAYSSLMSAGGSLKGMAMGMAVQVAMKKLMPQVTIGTEIADKAVSILSTAYGRIAFFAAATALVMIIDSGLKKEEKASEKRLADLQKVKDAFKKNSETDNELAEGGTTKGASGGGGPGGAKADPSKKTYALKSLPTGVELSKHCYSKSEGGGVDYSEAGCKNPIKLARPTFDAKFNIPALTAGTNAATDMAQAVADGNLSRADIEAGNLGSQAGRLDAIKNDLMKKLNDQLKKDGKKPIDVNGELQRQITDLNNGLNQAQPGSGNYSLADVTGDEASVSETPTGDSASGITTASTTASVALPVPGEDIDLSNIGEGGLTEESIVDPNAANVASLDESLNEFESTEGDIAKDPDVSIFKQVSNRYFLNYTKIFNRKEINPPLKEEAAPAP